MTTNNKTTNQTTEEIPTVPVVPTILVYRYRSRPGSRWAVATGDRPGDVVSCNHSSEEAAVKAANRLAKKLGATVTVDRR